MSTTAADELREAVRKRYAEAARSVSDGSSGCCGSGSCCDGDDFGEARYSAEQRGELPDAAVLASLGCGNPVAVAERLEQRRRRLGFRLREDRSGERGAAGNEREFRSHRIDGCQYIDIHRSESRTI